MDCIFCKIVSRNIPSTVVYETNRFLVIKDINPQAPTHLVIMPKVHYPTLIDCDNTELMGEMLGVAKEAAMELGIDKRGFRLIINTNQEGGQTVFHLHMHLMGGRPLSGVMG